LKFPFPPPHTSVQSSTRPESKEKDFIPEETAPNLENAKLYKPQICHLGKARIESLFPPRNFFTFLVYFPPRCKDDPKIEHRQPYPLQYKPRLTNMSALHRKRKAAFLLHPSTLTSFSCYWSTKVPQAPIATDFRFHCPAPFLLSRPAHYPRMK